MRQKTNKSKLIEINIPEGSIVSRRWLKENLQLTNHAIDNLVKSEKLKVLSRGIYSRGYSKINWQSIVYALQNDLKLDCVIGGITSLGLRGYAHYLPQGKKETIHLYGDDKLPNWINEISVDLMFVHHRKSKLFDGGNKKEKFVTGFSWGNEKKELITAVPERAFLELLIDVPDKLSFEHADQLIQGMTSFSPRILQNLLETCSSIKAKRLFLFLSEKYNYTWYTKLNLNSINLGSGNRMLIRSGKLNGKYKITVPKEFEK